MAHKPRKRFGQNFLTDEVVISQIIDAINPQVHQHLVEIGPGQGALTDRLCNHCQSLNLIELDRNLTVMLERRYTGSDQVRIHQLDALQLDLTELIEANTSNRATPDTFRLIGNLPYNISTPLIFHLLDQADCIDDMHFMLQKEVAERLAANPGSKQYGRLSVISQYHCEIHRLFNVSPDSFYPAPRVWSSIVRLVPHASPPVVIHAFNAFNQLVTQAFAQRRKTLRNTLSGLLTPEQLQACDIDPGRRAETLSLDEFARLANQVDD
ncbi:MAG: 16S rRNA (adenine(1518)-N(6)/adenine(1519)-N(6))-dimethyltransferase RsmA [Gammaproteobacteria bacterium]|nr:16S rRNA (adenine(1518)-N(6)/adenine(1519)-N(6))-dimethyltransferase RsmA [Gammaproteobacteria bacterium]